MAVVFLITDNGTLIALDATTQVSRNKSGSVTSNTVQSGSNISDHYHTTLPIISFGGILTESKIRDITPSIENIVGLVDDLMESKQTFTLYGTTDGAIPDLDRCVILDFMVNRDTSTANSLNINLSLQQVDISNSAKLNKETLPAKSTEGQLAEKKNGGQGTKTAVEDKYTQEKQRQLGIGRFAPDPTSISEE